MRYYAVCKLLYSYEQKFSSKLRKFFGLTSPYINSLQEYLHQISMNHYNSDVYLKLVHVDLNDFKEYAWINHQLMITPRFLAGTSTIPSILRVWELNDLISSIQYSYVNNQIGFSQDKVDHLTNQLYVATIMAKYDIEKGILRRLFGDSPIIKAIHKFLKYLPSHKSEATTPSKSRVIYPCFMSYAKIHLKLDLLSIRGYPLSKQLLDKWKSHSQTSRMRFDFRSAVLENDELKQQSDDADANLQNLLLHRWPI